MDAQPYYSVFRLGANTLKGMINWCYLPCCSVGFMRRYFFLILALYQTNHLHLFAININLINLYGYKNVTVTQRWDRKWQLSVCLKIIRTTVGLVTSVTLFDNVITCVVCTSTVKRKIIMETVTFLKIQAVFSGRKRNNTICIPFDVRTTMKFYAKGKKS